MACAEDAGLNETRFFAILYLSIRQALNLPGMEM